MQKFTKKLLSLMLALVTAAAMLPSGAVFVSAANEIPYIDENGSLKYKDAAAVKVINSAAVSDLPAGWYLFRGTVVFNRSISVSGTGVHVILEDGCDITVKSESPGTSAGISVLGGRELTIYAQSAGASMGRLTASGSEGSTYGSAGIGGGGGSGSGSGSRQAVGKITINGGMITASGAYESIAKNGGGAGIGSGSFGASGTVVINGGTVNAVGGGNAAGIGGGWNSGGGTVIISGGKVTAAGLGRGAGIGGGQGAQNNAGDILIYGEQTVVTAIRGTTGATQDIGSGVNNTAGNIFVCVKEGNLKNAAGNTGSSVTFSAEAAAAGAAVKASLSAPYYTTVNLFGGLLAPKTMSVIVSGLVNGVVFSLEGHENLNYTAEKFINNLKIGFKRAQTGTGNLFEDLKFKENTVNSDDPDIIKNLPYRDNSPLKSVRELYIPKSGGASSDVIIGKNKPVGTDPLYYSAESVSGSGFKIPGTITFGASSYTGCYITDIDIMYEGDFDGDGRKNELAIIAEFYSGGNNTTMYGLFAGSAESASVVLTPVSLLSSNVASAVPGFKFESGLVCADANGDGIDEIIAAPAGSSEIQTYYLPSASKGSGDWKNASKWRKTAVNFGATWSHSGAGYTFPISDLTVGNPGVAFSIAAGDIDRDGCEDIAYIASSFWNGQRNGAYRSAYVLFGKRFADIPQYEQIPMDLHDIPNLPEGKGDKNQDGSRAFGRFGISICDLDGDMQPEILTAFVEASELYYKTNYGKYIGRTYNIVSLKYQGGKDARGGFKAEKILRAAGAIRRTGLNSDDLWYGDSLTDLPCHDPEFSSTLCVAKLEYDFGMSEYFPGSTAHGTIVVNGGISPYVVSLGDKINGAGSYTTVYDIIEQYEDMDLYEKTREFVREFVYWYNYNKDSVFTYLALRNNVRFRSIRQTTISGGGDGLVMAYYDCKGETSDKTKDSYYTKYFDCSGSNIDDRRYYSEIEKFGKKTQGGKRYHSFALPDVDYDSIYLKYESHNFFWSDPRVVAALAAAPYFAALPGDYWHYGSTSYGKSKTEGESLLGSYSNSMGAYVSVEFSVGSKYVSGSVESEVGYNHTWTHSTEEFRNFTFEAGFTAAAGQDHVVIASNAFDVYNYTMYMPKGDNPDGTSITGTPYTVVVPRVGGIQQTQINYDQYKEIRAAGAFDILPDLSGVFTHTPGFPDSYPKSVPNDAQNGGPVKRGSEFYKRDYFGSFPFTDGTNNQSYTVESGVSETKTQTNSITGKLGVGLKIGTDEANITFKAGVTFGSDRETGKVVSNSEGVSFEGVVAGQGTQTTSGFNWQLLTYTYTNNPNKNPYMETHEFPVVTYIVKNVVLEKGHTPDSVTVIEQNPDPLPKWTPSSTLPYEFTTFRVIAPGIEKETPVELSGAPVGMELLTTTIAKSGQSGSFISISINANVEGGSYPLTLKVGGMESNEFYLNVTAPVKVTVKNKIGGTAETRTYRPGDVVNIDVSAWRNGAVCFNWTNDYSDLIRGFDLGSPKLSFIMPYLNRDLEFIADFHTHNETINQIKIAAGTGHTAASLLNAPDISDYNPVSADNRFTCWADFGFDMGGTQHTPVFSNGGNLPAVIWTIDSFTEGSEGSSTTFTDFGYIGGSPYAVLTIDKNESAGTVTVTAAANTGSRSKALNIINILPAALYSDSKELIVPTSYVMGGETARDIPYDIIVFSKLSGLTIESAEIIGDNTVFAIYNGPPAGTVIPDTGLPVTIAVHYDPDYAGEYWAVLKITANQNILEIPLFYEIKGPNNIMYADPGSHEFTSAELGYGEQPEKTFTLGLKDDPYYAAPVKDITFKFSGGDIFEIAAPLTVNTLSKNETATFAVRPKTGLAKGLHTAVLYIDGVNSSMISVPLSFEVTVASTVQSVTIPLRTFAAKGGIEYFNAVVEGTGNPSQEVIWSVEGASPGTRITDDGILYISANETNYNFTVRATSVENPAISGTSSVILTASSAPELKSSGLIADLLGGVFNMSPPAGESNEPYSHNLPNNGAIKWNIISGKLPEGLAMSPDGAISGTPQETGTFSFTVMAKDTNGVTDTRTLTIKINAKNDGSGAPVYSVALTNGGTGVFGAGGYKEGETVTINAGRRDEYSFAGWTLNSGGIILADEGAAETVFEMPANDVFITANWKYTGGGTSETTQQPPAEPAPVTPAPQEAAANPSAADLGGKINGFSISALGNISAFRVKTEAGTVILTKKMLEAYKDLHGDMIEVSLKKSGSFILDILKDKKSVNWNDPANPVFIRIPVNPGENDAVNAYTAVIKTAAGNVILPYSVYKNNELVFQITSSGTFEIIRNIKEFADTPDHWASDYIRFVSARGLFSGIGENLFAPDLPMTRAMFAQVLANIEGADLTGFKTSVFDDVKTDKWFAPAIEWAAKAKIVSGYGNGSFGPEDNITREQMAVMLVNYVKYKGYELPKGETTEFADEENIADWALGAVKQIQAAGIVNGKPGNIYDPKGIATRCEIAAIFARFIEAYIETAIYGG